MGKIALPPLPPAGLARLRRVLRRLPPACRADAVQDSWVAYLSGGSPVGAVVTCSKRIKRVAARERCTDPARIAVLTDSAAGRRG
jgi:hypothetical protein